MRGRSLLDRVVPWLVPAFGLALLDVLVAMWPAPPAYRYPPTLLHAIGLNLLVAAGAIGVALAVIRPVARPTGLSASALAGVTVAWGWMVLIAAAPSNRFLQPGACRGDALVCGAHLSRVLPAAIAFLPVIAALARSAARTARESESLTVVAAIVPLLAFAVPLEWWIVYGRHARGLGGTWLALAMFMCAAGAVWVAVWRGHARGLMRAAVVASVLAVGLMPAWMPLWAFGRYWSSARASGDGAPDLVLLITIDSLRADAVSFDAEGHTPRLAQLARESVVFTRAVSPSSWTLPAFASLLTGLSPAVHLADASGQLPASAPTLPDILRRHGYTTGAIVDNPLFAPPSAFADRFDDTWPLTPAWSDAAPLLPLSVGPRARRAMAAGRREPSSSAVTAQALSWLRRVSTGRAFLWVHYLGPHGPYTPGAGAAARAESAAGPAASAAMRDYLGEVVQADDEVGALLDGLRRDGRLDDALVILTSDHGEELGERGETGHGRHLHAEVIDVPLLLKLPGASGGAVVDERVSTQSLPATVLDVSGIVYDAGLFESPSLAGLARGRSGDVHEAPVSWLLRFYRGSGRPQAAAFHGDFKYVRLFDPDEEQLYDLGRDPRESVSVAANHPDVVAEARRALEAARTRAEARRRQLRIVDQELKALDPDRIKALRALGYIQ